MTKLFFGVRTMTLGPHHMAKKQKRCEQPLCTTLSFVAVEFQLCVVDFVAKRKREQSNCTKIVTAASSTRDATLK